MLTEKVRSFTKDIGCGFITAKMRTENFFIHNSGIKTAKSH